MMYKFSQLAANTSNEIRTLTKFVGVGLVATGVHTGLALILANFLGFHPIAANISGFTVAFFISFFGHFFWTFANSNNTVHQTMPRFIISAIIGAAASNGLLWILLNSVLLPNNISILASIAIVPLVTFLLSRLWIFNARKQISKS